jgi:hypothetical protein
MRTSFVALLAGVLVSLAFAVGCAGDEEPSENASKEQGVQQDTQPTKQETTEERTQARAKDGKGKTRSEEAVLEVQGDSGTEFSGSCTVGDEETEVSGQVPESFSYELDGERLECELRKEGADGNLQIDLSVGPNVRSVQQISGGTLNLTYDNGRISSSVSSGSGAGSTSSQVVSSSSQSSSSSINISP